MPTIETDRLLLRPLCEDDAENLSRIYSDPEVVEFFQEEDLTPEGQGRRIALHVAKHWGKFGYGLYATILRENGELIGRCGYLHQELEGEEFCEVAYLIAREHWGQGFATEAAKALIQYGFEEMGRNLLVSLINKKNHRSIRVADKVGMDLLKKYPNMLMYGISGDACYETVGKSLAERLKPKETVLQSLSVLRRG